MGQGMTDSSKKFFSQTSGVALWMLSSTALVQIEMSQQQFMDCCEIILKMFMIQ